MELAKLKPFQLLQPPNLAEEEKKVIHIKKQK
jgi:hypothetical protein